MVLLIGVCSDFRAELFTLIVGPQQTAFAVHQEKLYQSPVLKRMCNSGFIEAQTKTMNLPDDEPRKVSLFIEYLYRGEYWPFKGAEFEAYRSKHEDQRAVQMQRQAELYCFAAMYELEGLQQLAVEKMQMLTPMSFRSFLSMSEHIYSNSDASGPFRPYCRQQLEIYLPEIARSPWLQNIVAKGGDLAMDLFSANQGIVGTLEDVAIVWPPVTLPDDRDTKSKKKRKHLRSPRQERDYFDPFNYPVTGYEGDRHGSC